MPKRKAAKAKEANTPEVKKKPGNKKAPEGARPATDSAASLDLKSLVTEKGWKEKLQKQFEQEYFRKLEALISNDIKAGKTIFPPKENIFHAFDLTPFEKVNVVILGQDPYHDDGQAHGLSFSVPPSVKAPPSLKNIYKELVQEYPDYKTPDHGNLESWANQGVLLLNATLTVEAHKPNSHAKYGWLTFTDNVLKLLSDQRDGLVFILWGNFAQKKSPLINETKHTVIKTAHPSPLSVTKFLGCNCFKMTNEALVKYGKTPIDWSL